MDISGLIASVVVAVGVFIWGVMRGKRADKADQLKRNAEAHERAREAGNEMDGKSGDAVTEWLRRRGKQ